MRNRMTPERKPWYKDVRTWLAILGVAATGYAVKVGIDASGQKPEDQDNPRGSVTETNQIPPIVLDIEINFPDIHATEVPTLESTEELIVEETTEATAQVTPEATEVAELPTAGATHEVTPEPERTEQAPLVVELPTSEPEIFSTGMEPSLGMNSYLLNFPINSAADLIEYHNQVQQTNAELGRVSSDFLFDLILSGELDINAGRTVDTFGLDIPWNNLEGMEASVDTAFTQESLNASRTEFDFQPLVFAEGAFDHPAEHWNINPETGVQQFAYIAHDYDNAMTVAVLAAAGREELRIGSEAWSQLSQQERINRAMSLYTDWILRTRDTVEPNSIMRDVHDESGDTLFQLYFPTQGYRTRRIEAGDADTRNGQQSETFDYQCVRIEFQPENNVETPLNEFSRNGNFLFSATFDPRVNRDRVVMFDLSTAYVGLDLDSQYQEGDFINPMEPGCAPAPVVEVVTTPEAEVPPEEDIPTCEEQGNCETDTPTCEEENNCETEEPDKSNIGNQTNPDGETEPDPTGGQVIIDGEIDTDGDGEGDTPDNIGSGR